MEWWIWIYDCLFRRGWKTYANLHINEAMEQMNYKAINWFHCLKSLDLITLKLDEKAINIYYLHSFEISWQNSIGSTQLRLEAVAKHVLVRSHQRAWLQSLLFLLFCLHCSQKTSSLLDENLFTSHLISIQTSNTLLLSHSPFLMGHKTSHPIVGSILRIMGGCSIWSWYPLELCLFVLNIWIWILWRKSVESQLRPHFRHLLSYRKQPPMTWKMECK